MLLTKHHHQQPNEDLALLKSLRWPSGDRGCCVPCHPGCHQTTVVLARSALNAAIQSLLLPFGTT